MIKSWKRWGLEYVEQKLNLKAVSPSGLFIFLFLLVFYLWELLSLWVALPFSLLLLLFFLKRKKHLVAIFLTLATVAFFRANLEHALRTIPNIPEEGIEIEWIGKVESPVELYPDKIRLIVEIEKILSSSPSSEELTGRKVYVYIIKSTRKWLYGDEFIARTKIKPLREFKNPSPPSKEFLLKGKLLKNIIGQSYIKEDRSLKILDQKHSVFTKLYRLVDSKRQDFSSYIDKAIHSNEVRGFVKAITVGYRGFLEPYWIEISTLSGTNHLLAISGLHFASIAFLSYKGAEFILKGFFPKVFLKIPKPLLSPFIALPAVVLYGLLSGFSAPTTRAFLFVVLATAGVFFLRYLALSRIILLSAFFIILSSPHLAYSPSFILSFGAVTAISEIATKVHPPIRTKSLTAHLRNTFWISFSVQIALFPLILYFFSRFSWVGLIANIILVPLVSMLVLPLSLLLLITKLLIGEGIANLLVLPVEVSTSFSLTVMEFFGKFQEGIFWGILNEREVFLYILLLTITSLGLRKISIPLNALLLILIPLSFQTVIVLSERKTENLEALFMDVGDGLSILVSLPGSKTFLIDGGGFYGSRFDPGKNIVVPSILSLGFRHVDYVLLSHYHLDHAKGLEFVISSFPVKSFIEPLCPRNDPTLPDLREISRKRKIEVVSFEELGSFFAKQDLRGVLVNILHPQPLNKTICHDLNNSSTVLSIKFGKVTILIPSDVDIRVFSSIASSMLLQERDKLILLSPHHGSCKSFDEDFYSILDPSTIIISSNATRKNIPCKNLIRWCSKENKRCFITAKDGAIMIKTNGSSVELYKTKRNGKLYPLTSF